MSWVVPEPDPWMESVMSSASGGTCVGLLGDAEVGLCGSGLGGGFLSGERGRVDVLAGQQVLVDLAQRDRQRLLLDVRVDQGADVLEEALTELGVVGVDLPSALGAVEDQLVLGVRLGEQIVDRGVGDTLAGRSEEHTSELQSLMRISYAVFCLKKKKTS